ncbi:hypothetical protein SAMN06295967_10817 [Belliella buryatensis]|uniref:Uncharacterized protein n=1 Tax=Belliella buryatensis TaxID=1500549 RepID=A0A239DSH0_9BACT|nr:hypothetical protein SAMN06295967_10817 [Belliella buryatensis]
MLSIYKLNYFNIVEKFFAQNESFVGAQSYYFKYKIHFYLFKNYI